MEGVLVRPTIRGYFFKHYLFVAVFSLAAFALLAGSLLNWLMIDLRIGQGLFIIFLSFFIVSLISQLTGVDQIAKPSL
jgi:hypothetical protein